MYISLGQMRRQIAAGLAQGKDSSSWCGMLLMPSKASDPLQVLWSCVCPSHLSVGAA